MTKLFFGLLAGLIFGAGLALAGMTDPAVVIGFLDFAGSWNPALLVVMGVGVVVTFIGYRLVLQRKEPLFADRFILPTTTAIDRDLVLGSALFGIGWGLAGYCPGPALASLSAGRIELIAFVIAAAIATIGVRALRRP